MPIYTCICITQRTDMSTKLLLNERVSITIFCLYVVSLFCVRIPMNAKFFFRFTSIQAIIVLLHRSTINVFVYLFDITLVKFYNKFILKPSRRNLILKKYVLVHIDVNNSNDEFFNLMSNCLFNVIIV